MISYNENDEYDTLTHRMALIWKHASEKYPDFKWYARFWDDNYVVPSTFEALIPSSFDVSSPLEIGRLALANEGGRLVPVDTEHLITEAMHPYIDGGAGSLLSHEGMTRLVDGLEECFAWFKKSMHRQIPLWQRVEDVTFGTCAFNLFGTKFRRALGLYHQTHNIHNAAQHLCRHEPYAADHESEVSVPRVFHYATAEDMFFIDRQWYECFMPDDDHCLSRALPEDQIHIVVAVHSFLASSVLEWVETLGFSRASVFLYYREQREIRHYFIGRCQISVYERVLTPNVGHEAAPYLAHILQFYDHPPELMLFAHHHGPDAWHSTSESFVRRARAYYRGLTGAGSAMEREFASLHASLSRCDAKDGEKSICCINTFPVTPYSEEIGRTVPSVFYSLLQSNGIDWQAETQQLSCCATFMARPRHLQHRPRALYQQLLDLLVARSDLPSFWFEHNLYFLFGGAGNFSNTQLYRDIDSHAENSVLLLELTHNLNGKKLVLKPSASNREIYDILLFHNELDMLELRLFELEHVVDCFVIIEQPHTLAGSPKPLYFKGTAALF